VTDVQWDNHALSLEILGEREEQNSATTRPTAHRTGGDIQREGHSSGGDTVLHLDIGNLALAENKAGRSAAYADITAHLPRYVGAVLGRIGIHPQAVTVLESETNVTLRVDAASGSVVVKISPWPDDLFVSTTFFQRLAGSGLPLPHVLLLDDSRATLPYDVQVLAWMEGTDLRDLPQRLHGEAGVVLGRALRTIHGVRTEGFGSPCPGGGWSAPTWRTALRPTYDLDAGPGAPLFSAQERQAIEEMVFDTGAMEISQPHLIHGDVVPNNALFRLEDGHVRLAGIIDPGGIVGGDPMFDLAGGTSTGDVFGRGLWEGYTHGHPLTAHDEYRYRRLLLLSSYGAAWWHYTNGADYQAWKARTLATLGDLMTSL